MGSQKHTAFIFAISVLFNQVFVHGSPAPDSSKESKNGLEMDPEAKAAFELMSKEGSKEWLEGIQMASQDVTENGELINALENEKALKQHDKNFLASGVESHVEVPGNSDPVHHKQKGATLESFTQNANKLQQQIASFKGTAGKAKAGINDLVKKYDSASDETKANMNNMVSTTVTAIGKFANAEQDPIGAVQATLDIVSSISAFAGPVGGLISMGLSFISGILGLFGQGLEAQKPIGEVVREVIEKALDKFYDRTLKDQAHGCIEAFQHSKAFLDGVASAVDGQISDNSVSSLSAHVPVYSGLEFMGTLASVIRDLITKNSVEDGNKIMSYIELYSELATLKDMILLQLAALIPDSQNGIRAGVWGVHDSVQSTSRAMLKFLYSSDLRYYRIVSYFDPYRYPITDGYLQKILNLAAPDRSMYGVYSIRNLNPGQWYLDYLSFDRESPRSVVTVEKNDPVDWLLIPRGNNYFTIESLWGCDNGNELCRAMLSWDFVRGHPYCTIEHNDPVYWQLKNNGNGYRLINTSDCPSGKWCNAELSWDSRIFTYPISSVEFGDPCDWEIKRLRDYTP